MLWISSFSHPSEGYTQAGLNYLMALFSAGRRDLDIYSTTAIRWDEMPHWAEPLRRARQMGAPQRPVIAHLPPTTIPEVRIGGARRAGLTVFETDRIPRWAASRLNESTDAMIVAAKFNEAGLRDAGYSKPIHVIPHTIGPWWWETCPPPNPSAPFTFTYIGTWNPRKNPQQVLRAYLDAFPQPREGVALALKLTASLGTEGAVEAIAGGRKDVWVWTDQWTERQIQWLHSQTSCYVTAHHGEGWGMGPFQAKLLGRPVIYTDWSAVCDFCAPEHGDIPVEYDLADVPEGLWGIPYFEETGDGALRWANPRHASLVDAMRHMADGRHNLVSQAAGAAADLRKRFSWETVGADFSALLDQLPT